MRTSVLQLLLLTSLLASADAEEVHQVAVRAHSGVEAGIKQWGPTIDYLSKSIPGHRFEIMPYTHIDQQIDDARQNKFQFFLTNPSIYIEINHLAGAHALLTLINKRQDTAQTRFGSVIFTRANRDDIIRLEDLKNKHLIAVSPLGFGGWQVAWREMLHNNFDPYEDLGQLSFADGNQPAVVEAVRNSKADAGVVRTDMLERLAQKGKINLTELRILHNVETDGFPFFHSTRLYPEWPFAVMPGVSNKLATQVTQALLNIRADHPAAQAGKYKGWTEALDYSTVDELLKELAIAHHKNSVKTTYTPANIFFILTGIIVVALILKMHRKKTSN